MRNRNLILGLLATLVVIVLIGGAMAFAASDGDENFTGSVPAPEENGPEGSHDEAAEARQLRELAQIDRNVAEEAALQAVPGTVRGAELEDENGFVVYEVEVAGNDGQTHHVDVDAGNGNVLHQETGEENESDEEGA